MHLALSEEPFPVPVYRLSSGKEVKRVTSFLMKRRLTSSIFPLSIHFSNCILVLLSKCIKIPCQTIWIHELSKNQLLTLISVDHGKSWQSCLTSISVKCNPRIHFTGSCFNLDSDYFPKACWQLMQPYPCHSKECGRRRRRVWRCVGQLCLTFHKNQQWLNGRVSWKKWAQSSKQKLSNGQPWHGPIIGAKLWCT